MSLARLFRLGRERRSETVRGIEDLTFGALAVLSLESEELTRHARRRLGY